MKKTKKAKKIRKGKILFIIVSITVLLLILISLLGFCAFSANRLVNSVVDKNPSSFNKHFNSVKKCGGSIPLVGDLDDILGDKTYIVLLQNNAEIRPSGGFMGSYARVEFSDNTLDRWEIFDIYTPDGQLEGHVDPVIPFQQAFWTGDYRLRNANWDVDFTDAAKDIEWFFDKGGEKDFDGIIALNLGLVKEILRIVGPVKPLDFPEEVDADTFYEITQKYAEEDFFPGSRRKKTYLGAVGDVLWEKIFEAGLVQKVKIAKLVYKQLNDGQILVWVKDAEVHQKILKAGWGGSLGDYEQDYIYLVEANMGANKANCCVEREIVQNVYINGGVSQELVVSWKNNNKSSTPTHPLNWGGNYINYQRVVLPRDANLKSVFVGKEEYTKEVYSDLFEPPKYDEDKGYAVEENDKFKTIGFWVIVPAQGTTQAKIVYELHFKDSKEYKVKVKRQPGIYSIPYTLTINNEKIIDTTLTKDEEYEVRMK